MLRGNSLDLLLGRGKVRRRGFLTYSNIFYFLVTRVILFGIWEACFLSPMLSIIHHSEVDTTASLNISQSEPMSVALAPHQPALLYRESVSNEAVQEKSSYLRQTQRVGEPVRSTTEGTIKHNFSDLRSMTIACMVAGVYTGLVIGFLGPCAHSW